MSAIFTEIQDTSTAPGSKVLYTCPAGISYQSVTVSWCTSSPLTAPNNCTLRVNGTDFSATTNNQPINGSMSLILAPGDTLGYTTTAAGSTFDLTLSGYTVP